MPSATITASGTVGQKPTAVGLTTVETDVTISCPSHPKGWIVTLVADADWLYHSDSGGTVTDGMPMKANQPMTLALRDATTLLFRARVATSTAKLHALVLQ